MSSLIIIGYLANAFLLAYFLMKNGLKTWSVNLFASIFMFVFYCLIPLLSITLYDASTTDIAGYTLSKQKGLLSLECLFAISIGFFTYGITYSIVSKKLSSTSCSQLENLNSHGLNVTLIIAYAIIVLSTISCILYIKGFGSFQEAVSMAESIRSGSYAEENEEAGFLFFKRFIQLAYIPLLIYPLTRPKRLFYKILYIGIPCVNLLILYVYLDNSRQGLITLLLIPIFAYLIEKKKIGAGWLSILLVVILLISPILDSFFSTRELVNAEQRGFLRTIFGELGFPFFSLQISGNYEAPLNWFSDFYTGIFGTFLPSSWSPNIEGSKYYNSITLGMPPNTVPPGLLAEGYYACRIFGVIIITALTGWIFAKLDNFFSKHPYGTKYIYAFAILSSLSWIRTGTPSLYLYHPLNVSALLFVWFLYKRHVDIRPRPSAI